MAHANHPDHRPSHRAGPIAGAVKRHAASLGLDVVLIPVRSASRSPARFRHFQRGWLNSAGFLVTMPHKRTGATAARCTDGASEAAAGGERRPPRRRRHACSATWWTGSGSWRRPRRTASPRGQERAGDRDGRRGERHRGRAVRARGSRGWRWRTSTRAGADDAGGLSATRSQASNCWTDTTASAASTSLSTPRRSGWAAPASCRSRRRNSRHCGRARWSQTW